MLLRKGKSSANKQRGKTIPVQVKAYEERDGVLGVLGTDLVNDREVFVTLTDRGEMASHKRRPTLKKFRDHKLMPKEDIGVDPGGVILFRYTYQIDDDRLVSAWPEYMAANEEDAARVRVGNMASVWVRENDKGELFGRLTIWQPDSVQEASAETLEETIAKVVDGVHGYTKGKGNAVVLIRGINADGEVTGYMPYTARYNKDEKRMATGAEVVEDLKGRPGYKAVTGNEAAVKFEVLPAVELPLSQEVLSSKPEKAKAWAAAYTDKHGLLRFAKPSVYRTEETGQWVVQASAIEPYGEGVSPAKLAPKGQMREFCAELAAEEEKIYREAVAELEKQPAPEAAEEAEANPFAEEPSM